MKPPRIGIIDSGVYAAHPHVVSVAGGVAFRADGSESDDYVDRLGHGTAVTAVIREKAPDAEVYCVKVFEERLTTNIETLLHAIRWCAKQRMALINLSLGTANRDHAGQLQELLDEAAESGSRIVSAVGWLPGDLVGSVPVDVDWTCPRNEFLTEVRDGRTIYLASGYPRPRPGVPVERNLKGISFAVANVTGLLARAL
ncbi:MAG: S8 family serine peptidase [Acidobacteriaceae bacterium]|nr:S8 family serine peptidase [Acidobacteriaceae bacterium]